MNSFRKASLRLAALMPVALVFMHQLAGHARGDGLEGARPNIVLVMTDDQGYGDLGCHGHPYLKTPHLDELRQQSTRFTDFHASPTCAPTRAALMSGRAPFKNGITHTILERDRMALASTTIAEVLKSAGYTTGIFGKWHLGDADAYQPHNRGFDETFIHGAGGIGQRYSGTQSDAPGTNYFDPIIKHNDAFVQTRGYCTDVFFQQALGWIKDQQGKPEQPFFAYIATNAPHSPYHVEGKYSDPYKDKCSEQSANFFGMIANIDENMGLLMRKLDEWELADNTLLIFMTDNGSAAGTYNFNMKGRKGSPDEGGSRVPLFMRLPGKIQPGLDVSNLARHYDLFPTLAAFASASIPKNVELDGRSLLPLLEEPEVEWEDRNLFFHVGRWSKAGAPGRWGEGNTDPDGAKYKRFAVRNQKWRLVGEQLFEVDKDPGQTNNVAANHPDVVAGLRGAFDQWWTEVRPLMVNEGASLDVEKPFESQYKQQQAESGIPEWIAPDLEQASSETAKPASRQLWLPELDASPPLSASPTPALVNPLRPEFENQLTELIKLHNLVPAQEIIREASMECLRIYSDGADDQSIVGGTRFGGEPDLPVDFEWPQIEVGGETKYSNFICQLNFADLPEFAGRDSFPRAGLMSIFVYSMASAADPVGLHSFYWDLEVESLELRPSPPSKDLADEYLVELKPTRVRFVPGFDCEAHDRRLLRAVEDACPHSEGASSSARERLGDLVTELPSSGSIGQLGGTASNHEESCNLLRQLVLSRMGRRDVQFSDYWDSMEEYEASIQKWGKSKDTVERYERMRSNVEWLQSKAEEIHNRTDQWQHLLRIDSNKTMQFWINDADPMYIFVRRSDLKRGDFNDLSAEVTQG